MFKSLVQTIFAGQIFWDIKPVTDKQVNDCIKIEKFNYLKEILTKTMNQFIQMMEHQQHTIILGRVGIGKTSLVKKASEFLDSKVYPINPIGIPPGFLFGFRDSMFFEKGVLENILEDDCQGYRSKWILFDGPWQSNWTDSISSLFQKLVFLLIL